MTFELTILGSSSATPAHDRNPSAQVLNIHAQLILIDCGEATQIQLSRYKIKAHSIRHIFISHLHGDHYLGLIGLLSTMHLQGRTAEIHLHAHQELKEIIDVQLKYSDTKFRYPLVFHELPPNSGQILLNETTFTVESIRMNHRIPCSGFVFREKKAPRKLIKEKLAYYRIPPEACAEIKTGKDYFDAASGKNIRNEDLTIDSLSPRNYAYCPDTIYDESILPFIKNADLLYHEATFANDMAERARETFHTTAEQAAMMASRAEARRLIIGHFSARYKDLNSILSEARNVFPETHLALEGKKFTL